MSKYRRLNLAEREELSRGLACGLAYREIARGLGRDVASVSREVRRNAACVGWYRANEAEGRARRRRARRSRRLHRDPRLRAFVLRHLRLAWSPEQIAEGLKRAFPQDPSMRLSHEALYTYLYVLPRGGLRKELLGYLRQHRKQRHRRSCGQDRRGQIPEMLSIEERPAEVAERSVPGHWEGEIGRASCRARV